MDKYFNISISCLYISRVVRENQCGRTGGSLHPAAVQADTRARNLKMRRRRKNIGGRVVFKFEYIVCRELEIEKTIQVSTNTNIDMFAEANGRPRKSQILTFICFHSFQDYQYCLRQHNANSIEVILSIEKDKTSQICGKTANMKSKD